MKVTTFLKTQAKRPVVAGIGLTLVGLLLGWPVWSSAQDKKNPPPAHTQKTQSADKPADSNKELLEQIKQLRATVAQLEAAVNKMAPATGSAMAAMGGKKAGQGMSGMGMMDMAMMGGMQVGKKGMAGMSMMDTDMNMMGMMGMGSMSGSDPKMKAMSKMKMAAALPGFPGASHIYHIGATGFFLDHPEHISLSTEQEKSLNRIKEKALMAKATSDRKIEEAEQQLWELTSADEPDAAKIQAQVESIERIRGEQRLAVIRAVGDAAKVLTDEQRKILLGTTSPKSSKPAAHSGHGATP